MTLTKEMSDWINYGVIALYTLVVIGIGIYFSREKKDSETYLLGGRTMPSWAIGLACMMSLFSSISIVMVPGEIFNNSLMLFFISGFLGPLLVIPCYLLFARFYFQLGSFTPYEYLEYRYDSNVRAVIAISSFFTRIIYIGMVLYTSAKIFEGGYHWPPWFSILLVAIVGIACCFIGGSKAVVWTDVFQALITFGGLFAVVVMLCWKIGGNVLGVADGADPNMFVRFFQGVGSAVGIAFQDGHGIPDFATKEFYTLTPYVRLLFILLLWATISTHITNASSDQVTVQRILSTKDWKAGLKAQVMSTCSGFVFMIFLYFIGLALYTYYKQCPDDEIFIGSGRGDMAFFHFVSTFMPVGLAGLFMAAMLAAIMSTVSGVTNSMAAVWLKEFHAKFVNKNMTDQQEFKVLRWATLLIGAFGIAVALAMEFAGKWLQQSVSEVSTIFWVLGAAVLPAFLFAVFSKRANSKIIWAYTFFALGETVAYNCWYAMSKDSLIKWQEATKNLTAEAASKVDFGWAGKLDARYVWIWLIVAIVLLLPYLFRNKKWSWALLPVAIIAGIVAIPAFACEYKFITINNATVYFVVITLFVLFKAQFEAFFKTEISMKLSALFSFIFFGVFTVMVTWWAYSNACITDEPLARSFQFTIPTGLIIAAIALRFCPVQPKKKWQGLTIFTVNEKVITDDEEAKQEA